MNEETAPQSIQATHFRALWVLLVLAALISAFLGYHYGRAKILVLEGGPETWIKVEQKKELADYLNRQVKVPGFKAKCVSVVKGQNYWSIAKQHGVNIDTIVGFNPDMANLNAYIDRAVLVSNERGTLHWVKAGDSPASIEGAYDLESGTVKAYNKLGLVQALREGQVLFLPDAMPKPVNKDMAEIYLRRSYLRSPLSGRYTSLVGTRTDPFTGGTRTHNGVDIKAPFNSLVAASADGKVTLAGWNGGYGKCVVIEHDHGLRTLYGHLNTVLVKVGDKVRRNQYIGRVGKTGRTTGPHLHFTIWKDGKIQNPLKYLW